MHSNIFIDSVLARLTLMEINCKRLESPPKGAGLRVVIGAGLNLNEKKTTTGYDMVYSTDITFEEGDETKLCSLKYATRATYKIDCSEENIKKEFKKTYPYFMRELYNLTREQINETLHKSGVKFSLPIGLPDDLKQANLT
jgi:hypothetical protein